MKESRSIKAVFVGFLASFIIYSSDYTYALEGNKYLEKLNSEAEEKAKDIEKPFCYYYDYYYGDNNSHNSRQYEDYESDKEDAALESVINAFGVTRVGQWIENVHERLDNYSTLHLAGTKSGMDVSLGYEKDEEKKSIKKKDTNTNPKNNNEDKNESNKYDIYLSAGVRDATPVPSIDIYYNNLEFSMDYRLGRRISSEMKHKKLDELINGSVRFDSHFDHSRNEVASSINYELRF